MTDTNTSAPTGAGPDNLSDLPGEPGSPEHRQAARHALDALEGDPAKMELLFGGNPNAPGYRQLHARRSALYNATAPQAVPGMRPRDFGLDLPDPSTGAPGAAQPTPDEWVPGAIYDKPGAGQAAPQGAAPAPGAQAAPVESDYTRDHLAALPEEVRGTLTATTLAPDTVAVLAQELRLRTANRLSEAQHYAEGVRTESKLRREWGDAYDSRLAATVQMVQGDPDMTILAGILGNSERAVRVMVQEAIRRGLTR